MLLAIAISLLYVELKDSVLRSLFAEVEKQLLKNWELRVMLIVSLILQLLLAFIGRKRKNYTGRGVPAFAMVTWLLYLSADWMATLVLSTLLRGGTELQKRPIVFWTPFLLWHLGSPHNITAYSMEDNELWLRHFLGMVFQIGEAIYISVKFRSHTELNAMAIPLFIGGVIKYVERIWALRCASPKELIKECYKSPSNNPENILDNTKEMTRTGLFDLSKSRKSIGDPRIASEVKFLLEAHSSFDVFRPLFADLPFQISRELHDEMVYLKYMTAEEAFNFVGIELGFLYDLHYTKTPIQHVRYRLSLILRSICFFSLVSVLIAFSVSLHKIEHGLFDVDVALTYLLLLGAVYLETSSFFGHLWSTWTILRSTIRRNKLRKLHLWFAHYKLRSIKSGKGIKKMAQHNLIDYCVKAKGSWFTPVIKLINTVNLLQRFWHCKWKSVDIDLKEFIYHHLKEKRSKYQNEGFKLHCLEKLLADQGDNVLEKKGFSLEDGEFKMESTDFIRRIFVWHIATTLVHYDDLDNHRREASNSILRIGKSLSDYMMYLVLMQPSMLPNGFSHAVNEETYLQTLRFSPQRNTWKNLKVSMNEFITGLLQLPMDTYKSSETGALLEGLKFAQQLQSLMRYDFLRWNDEEKWRMISEVWMEMMVYAASRCTWEEHAKQLKQGGELLTHVSLLMAHLGLSTQVHRLEPDDHSGGFALPAHI